MGNQIKCGDGNMQGDAEQCDDGNTQDGDGCSLACRLEPGYDQYEGKAIPICGDSKKKGDEQCDDGNEKDSDGCSAACKVEDGWLCTGDIKSVCKKSVCGDGTRA